MIRNLILAQHVLVCLTHLLLDAHAPLISRFPYPLPEIPHINAIFHLPIQNRVKVTALVRVVEIWKWFFGDVDPVVQNWVCGGGAHEVLE